VKDIKELKSLLKLLRQNGVLTYNDGTLNISLSPDSHLLPAPSTPVYEQEADASDPWAKFPTGTLSADELMFYSSGGLPGDEVSS
jgi:hypothetical protein